jgi:hypothetical protein
MPVTLYQLRRLFIKVTGPMKKKNGEKLTLANFQNEVN